MQFLPFYRSTAGLRLCYKPTLPVKYSLTPKGLSIANLLENLMDKKQIFV